MSEDEIQSIIDFHTNVGPLKPVSYLPINTVVSILRMTVHEYSEIVKSKGNSIVVFESNRCCIKSGAVYAYHVDSLRGILNENKEVLSKYKLSILPEEFLEKIAKTWFKSECSIMPVIKKIFGDTL